jgi:hypothetical protein
MSNRGTFEALLGEIGQALLPLQNAFGSPESFFAFAHKLGWQPDTLPQPLKDLDAAFVTLFDSLRKVLGDTLNIDGAVRLDDEAAGSSPSVSADDITRALQAVQRIMAGIRAIETAPDAMFPPDLIADGFKTQFPRQVVDYLLITYLQTYHGSLAFALRALGVIKTRYVTPTGQRAPYVHYAFDFADLPKVLEDPSLVLTNAFGWGTPDFDSSAILSECDNLLFMLGVDTRSVELPTPTALAIEGASEDQPGAPRRTMLRGIIFERGSNGGSLSAEIRLMPLPARGADLPGLALMPAFEGAIDLEMSLFDDVTVTIQSDLDLQGGLALQSRPGKPLEMIVGFADAGSPVRATGSIDVLVERSAPDSAPPTIVLGSPTGSHLSFKKLAGTAGVRLSSKQEPDLFAEIQLVGLEFRIDTSESDGFIAKLLPKDGIRFRSDVTVGISYLDGIYFRGTSNLEISVPAHVQIGPIQVQSLTISAVPKDGTLPISLGATLKGDLGPVQAVVENIGLTATFAFPPSHDGNLGPIDVELGFKPPRAIGLAVNAAVVHGGGYVYLDPGRGEYAGELELTLADFLSIKAIGIITTRLPDGTKGFSLLIVMSVEFATGIQLGLGFRLLGVGGLLGLNRTMNLQALAEGVRGGGINSVMFPKDIIVNAPKIISDLGAFFPPRDGVFLIGPMLKIAWGTPTLISATLGVIIEIPGNIAILGVVIVTAPRKKPILLLQVQFLGAIEFDKKRLWFFATLFESRLAFLPIDGEMGLLVGWGGDDSNVVISVGGFHPQFMPPPLPFPSPRRVALSLVNTPTRRVRLECYLAVTSNTVQCGARCELFLGYSSFNLQGDFGFDALFQRRPFRFVCQLSASFAVKVFGVGAFSVGIKGTLEGTNPWHLQGHGSISLLFWSIDIPFDHTWGDAQQTELPTTQVLPLLRDELSKADAWRALPPVSNHLFVTLRSMPPEEAALLLHPVGVLRIAQRTVPLEIRLDRVGDQKPSDVSRLSIQVTSSGLAKHDDAFDQFAPAQFQDFSDADRLSQRAFVRERSGLELSSAGGDLRSSAMVKRVVRYEEIILDINFKRAARPLRSHGGKLFDFFVKGNAVSRATVSQASKSRLQPFAAKIELVAETYTVALQATNQPFATDGVTFQSEASAREFLARQIDADSRFADLLHVIPSHEIAA